MPPEASCARALPASAIESSNSAHLLAERIADPVDVPGGAVDQEDVEAAMRLRPAREVKPRRGDEPAALCSGYALPRAAVGERAPHAHLRKHEHATLLGNEVDFTQ